MTEQRGTLDRGGDGFRGVNGDAAAASMDTTDLINILDAVEVPVVALRRDFTISYFNKAGAETLGLSQSDIGRTPRDISVLAGLPRLEQQCNQVISGGLEVRADFRDGDKWFVVRISPYTIVDRQVTGILLTFTNVTAFRSSIDQAIYERESAKAILNAVAEPLVVLSADQRIQSGNRAFYTKFGVSRDETQGVPLYELGKGAFEFGQLRMQLTEMLTHSSAFQPVEVDHVLTVEGKRTFILNAHALSFPGRSERRVLVSFQDITVRKQAEAGLRELNDTLEKQVRVRTEELGLIINTIPALAWSARPDGSAEFFNQHYLAYVGLSLEQLQGSGWTVAVHPDDLSTLLAAWQSMMATGKAGEVEGRLRRFDGEYRWFLFRTNPMRDKSGKLLRWYGTNIDIDDRRRAEEALRDSEQSLRLILDGIAGLVAIMGTTGEVEAVNRQVLDYFGKSTEEMKGWSTSDAVHPDDLPGVISAWRYSLETGSPYVVDHRLRRADGVYRWFHARGLPLLGEEGRVVRWYVLLTDIDDRRRAEEALQASERELGLTINTIPALAWSARPDGAAEFFNQHYLAYVGLPLQKLQESGWTTAVHPDDLGALFAAWQSMMAAGKGGEVEGRLRRFDGEYRWFLFRANPMLDESGNILKWYGTNADIHDRKQAEEKLRRSEAFLTEGQKLSRIGNFSWLVATDDIKWSDQIYRIFEFELGVPVTFELIGSRVHPEDLPLLYDMIGRAQSGVSDFEYEHRLLMPDQSIKYLHLIGHGARDREGRQEYIGAVQDVTQRRLSEEALGKARSDLANVARVTSLGVLTASIAHEVNQPLSGIVTNASTCLRMLSADPPNVEGARETARRAIRDGNRASDVITRLRTLYSKKDLSPESMDLNEATREVTSLSLSELHSKGVILRHELADDLPPVIGDRVQLQQVILNLLRNAADAMSGIDDRPRDLLVRTEREEGDRVRLSVKDAGVGFTAQAAEKLFEAFFTTKTDGMGIGLSISRSIIEAHRGRLWAAPNDGPGATFAFSIPCSREGLTDGENRVQWRDTFTGTA